LSPWLNYFVNATVIVLEHSYFHGDI